MKKSDVQEQKNVFQPLNTLEEIRHFANTFPGTSYISQIPWME